MNWLYSLIPAAINWGIGKWGTESKNANISKVQSMLDDAKAELKTDLVKNTTDYFGAQKSTEMNIALDPKNAQMHTQLFNIKANEYGRYRTSVLDAIKNIDIKKSELQLGKGDSDLAGIEGLLSGYASSMNWLTAMDTNADYDKLLKQLADYSVKIDGQLTEGE